ncbi:MAG TPA: secretin N-terminal domain-containing protein [Lacipirellulaceae bacterium]|jgi:hypothetical protein|nr:secretin N-terminal domain-containing protein [Lacipirellulaceae bacterium]
MRSFRILSGAQRLPLATSCSVALALLLLNCVVVAGEPNPGGPGSSAPHLNQPNVTNGPPGTFGVAGQPGGPGFGVAPGGDVGFPTDGAVGSEGNGAPGGMIPGMAASPPNGSKEDIQRHLLALQKQQQALAHDYQETMNAIRLSLPPEMQLTLQRQELEERMKETQAQIGELTGNQPSMTAAPLPDNAKLRVFPLKYVKPEDIGQALHNIMGSDGPRIAVDERSNSLLIAGTEKQIGIAEPLVETLDQPGKPRQAKAPEAIQVRVVWVSEGMTDRVSEPPQTSILSPQVVDALRDLGMEQPQVVCQQVTSLALGQPDRRGDFHFQVPAQIEDATWQFIGQGTITPTADDRYAMDFNLTLKDTSDPNSQACQLGGSILTPLDHYTVMGTTTFVASQPKPDSGKVQRLSSFVVYLDRPKDFAGNEPDAKTPLHSKK